MNHDFPHFPRVFYGRFLVHGLAPGALRHGALCGLHQLRGGPMGGRGTGRRAGEERRQRAAGNEEGRMVPRKLGIFTED